MFEKKDYIKVRGIGKIKCKPELDVDDVQTVCLLASSVPFFSNEKGNDNQPVMQEFAPELMEYAFWASVILVCTDYKVSGEEMWKSIHTTDIVEKLSVYYSSYMDEMIYGVTERVNVKRKISDDVNDKSLFDIMAKSLEGVDIGNLLEIANAISNMDGHEIVKAAAEMEIP